MKKALIILTNASFKKGRTHSKKNELNLLYFYYTLNVYNNYTNAKYYFLLSNIIITLNKNTLAYANFPKNNKVVL
jgi:hypothetical protein